MDAGGSRGRLQHEAIWGEIFELMSSLVDKSLIEQRQPDDDEPRFRILETIREYSLERLQQSGEEASTKRAHAAYCLVLAEEGNPELSEAERVAWLDAAVTSNMMIFVPHSIFFFRLAISNGDFACARPCLGSGICGSIGRGTNPARSHRGLAGASYTRERAKTCQLLGAFTTAQGDFGLRPIFGIWADRVRGTG